jgi:hypothetical protein
MVVRERWFALMSMFAALRESASGPQRRRRRAAFTAGFWGGPVAAGHEGSQLFHANDEISMANAAAIGRDQPRPAATNLGGDEGTPMEIQRTG